MYSVFFPSSHRGPLPSQFTVRVACFNIIETTHTYTLYSMWAQNTSVLFFQSICYLVWDDDRLSYNKFIERNTQKREKKHNSIFMDDDGDNVGQTTTTKNQY